MASDPLAPPLLYRTQSTSLDINEVFNKFDGDGDGTITRADFTKVLQAIDRNMWVADKIEMLISALPNINGRVCFEDFVEWVFEVSDEQQSFVGSIKRSQAAEGALIVTPLSELPKYMLHDRNSKDYPRTSLRRHPSPLEGDNYKQRSAYNGEIVKVLGKTGNYINVSLALSRATGWLHEKHMHPCIEGTEHDRSLTKSSVKRVELKPTDGRIKEVRRHIYQHNVSRDPGEVRAEKVWFLQGHYLGEQGLEGGDKETLFFGCRDSWVDCIADSGFQEVFDLVSGPFGKGAHFSPDSCKAFLDSENYMFICEVAVGSKADRWERTTAYPELDYEQIRKEGFLSVQGKPGKVGTSIKYEESVVYHPSQCKPVYLVKLEYQGMYLYGGSKGTFGK